MTIQQYVKYALEKKQIEYHSFDPRAKFQCVDLVNDYITNVWGLKPIIGTNAKDFPEKLSEGMEFIKNTTEYLPEPGEVAVWNGKVGGGAGHIAVVTKKGLQTKLNSLDQNWSKPLFITEEVHSYANVRGFIRKVGTMPEKDELQECLAQHSKLVTEANKKDAALKQLETDLNKKDTKIDELKRSLEEKSQSTVSDFEEKRTKLVEKEYVSKTDVTADEVLSKLTSSIGGYKGEITKKENEITELKKQLEEALKPQGLLVGKRKMLVGLLTPIVAVAAKVIAEKFGVQLDTQELLYLVLAALAYIGIEGAKDFTMAVKGSDSTEKTDIQNK